MASLLQPSWICDPWHGMEEHSGVTVLRQNRRTWCPVFWSDVLEVACSPDAAQCLGSLLCHVTQHARWGPFRLSQHNLLSERWDVVIHVNFCRQSLKCSYSNLGSIFTLTLSGSSTQESGDWSPISKLEALWCSGLTDNYSHLLLTTYASFVAK